MALKDWSETASDNDDADGSINWSEGQAPSTVNGSARSMMAILKVAMRHLATASDYGATFDGTTVDTTAMNAVRASLSASGGVALLTHGTALVDGTLTLPTKVGFHGLGHTSSVIKLADSSDVDVLRTINFSALTGGGDTVVADGVPHGFELVGLNIDGNKANQTAGDGIKIYGKRYRVEDVLIRNVYGVGFYSECGNDGADTSTTWMDMPEAVIGPMWIDSSGSHNFQFRGMHDSRIDKLFSRLAGGDGVRVEASGATYSGLCDIGFIHSYANTLIGFYTNTKIKAAHLESESNFREGIYFDTNAAQSQIGLLEAFSNDVNETSTYWNVQIVAAECVVANAVVLDTKDSAGGIRISGASNRIADSLVKANGNANATAIGVDLDANQISFRGKINAYNTAGQTGLRTANGGGRNYLQIDAEIENCYTGWNHVTTSLGGNYRLRINSANKDHLLFTGAGPAGFDAAAGGGVRARDFWDVIAINTGTSHSGTADGGSATEIVFASTASTRNDVYNGCIVTLTGGTGSGAVGVVTDYVGSTKTATIAQVNGTTWNADNTSAYTCSTLTLASKTEGTGAIPSGSTSITIPHGLLETSITPTARNVAIWNRNSLGSANKIHVSAVTKFTFTVTADANPGATTAQFAWHARID